MTPKKLFDYLEGKMPAREREELETRLASDAQLQHELAIARKLHESMPGSQEMIGSLEDASSSSQRGAILARRVAVAFVVLVFLNVVLGLWFIFQHEKKSAVDPRESQVRRELEQSLERAAAAALPTPKIEADEIEIIAAASPDGTVAQVIAAAAAVGGSAAKALTDDRGIVVLVDIPRNREGEFRGKLVALGASTSAVPVESAKTGSPNERKFLQVRVTKASQP